MPRKPPKGKSLAEVNPKLAKQWHSTMNGDLTPLDVSVGSGKKVWWKCDKGEDHEWEAPILRRKVSGCSICSGKKVVKSNCLATTHPTITKEWHPIKNGNLSPEQILSGYSKKVWWKCDKGDGHEWEATPEKRKYGTGCPVCVGKKVVKSNCLATTHPEIAVKWHPSKNGILSPESITRYSNKSIWWKCDKENDHVFKSTVNNMDSSTCPMCNGDIIVISNCLVTTHPEIAKQWHPTLNYPITPKDTSKGRMEKYWWKCDKKDDHVFEDSPNARTSSKTNCPICSGKRVVKSNCLATTHPEIAKQWHPTLNGKNTTYNIIAGSGKKVWWKCDKGEDHEWVTAVSHRTTGTECPFCCNQKINIENSLQTLNPNLAKEWHPTKNGNLTPLNFGQGSSQKVWWRCNDNNEHEWNAKISDRSNGNGCPSCAKYGFDRQKIAIFYLREIYISNKKAIKFGITNNLKGDREKQQSRHIIGRVETIFKVKVAGELALQIERSCKNFFGRKGFLSKTEFPDGFTETIKYSEENLNNVKLIVDRVLNEEKR